MCSIVVLYNKEISDNQENLLRFRGPDDEHLIYRDGFLMKHYLLSLTGEKIKQPIVDEDICCLFNGEIYNYKSFGDFDSDVYSIIESYKRNGDQFITKLDGEFSIFLIDYKRKVFYISSDIFGIKPLFYSLDKGFGLSSHETFLQKNGYTNIQKIKPNTTLKFDFNFNLISELRIHNFSINQVVDTYDEWINNFLKSIEKRFKDVNYDIILPLSSGHDSGGIACAFNLLDIPYASYSILGQENPNILNQRMSLNKNKSYYIPSIDRSFCDQHLQSNCEPFYYGEFFNSKSVFGFDDPGAKGLVHILSETKKTHPNTKILASGQGSDEVMSNSQTYTFGGKKNPHYYDDNLISYFPWQNFFEGCNSSYLKKEESVSGSFGIEGRYPYLDKDVVQSFLNLTTFLKNKHFKAPLTHFMMKNNYPINNIKQGFNPSFQR